MGSSESKPKTPVVVVIDGIIGAAKTSYIQVIEEHLVLNGYRVTVVREPVDLWVASGILKRFYQDQSRWGYHFQTMGFTDRILESQRVARENPDTEIFLLERCPMTDRVFMELLHEQGKIDDLEMANYERWASLWYQLMPFTPDVSLYLRPQLETCMARLEKRRREGEDLISVEYQRQLQDKHDLLLKGPTVEISTGISIPTFQISTDQEFLTDTVVQAQMYAQFESILRQTVKWQPAM